MKLCALVVALAASALLSACNQTHEAAREAPPRPVLVADAHYAPREWAQVLAGMVKARVESDLAFRVGGKIAARLVDTATPACPTEDSIEVDELRHPILVHARRLIP